METKSGQSDPGSAPASSKGGTQIFLCDASAEGGRLLTALQAKGYAIVDVPLGLLPSRVHYEVPTLIVCDADALEAKRLLSETFEVVKRPIAVALIGQPSGSVATDEALRKLGSVFIARPLDLDTALDKVSSLAGPPSRGTHRPRIRLSSRAPLLVASARKPYRSDGYPSEPPESPAHDRIIDESLWPVDSPPGRGPAPVDSSRFTYEVTGRSQVSSSHPPSSDKLSLSSETQAVLEEGQRRVKAYAMQAPRPIRLPALAHSGGDEIRSEFLQALLEPLDEHLAPADPAPRALEPTASGDDENTSPGGKVGSAPPQSAKTGGTIAHRPKSYLPSLDDDDRDEEPTNPGGKPPTHPPPDGGPLHLSTATGSDEPPPLDDLSDLLSSKSSHPPTSLPAVSLETERPKKFDGFEKLDSTSPSQLLATIPPPTRKHSPLPDAFGSEPPGALPLSRPMVQLAPSLPTGVPSARASLHGSAADGNRSAESLRAEQRAVRSDSTEDVDVGAIPQLALAISHRRTGAVAQQVGTGLRRIVLTDGDITTVTSTMESESLAHFLRARGDISDQVLASLTSIPRYGRHGGAALIARGLLQQEDLWPVLRAHAEWIMERAIVSREATIFETSVPARILEEPAVFGGAAGTEIFLETIRRIVTPPQALAFFDDDSQVISTGENESLLGESALSQPEQAQVLDAVGSSIRQIMAKTPALIPIVLGLTHLGVLSTGKKSLVKSMIPAPLPAQKSSAEIDDEAFAQRVQTRRALVEDGDYFSILGISRAATSYEVERASQALLVEFADSRLTAQNAHLQPDLVLLRATVREARLVLSDDVRRQRYRAALEAAPR